MVPLWLFCAFIVALMLGPAFVVVVAIRDVRQRRMPDVWAKAIKDAKAATNRQYYL